MKVSLGKIDDEASWDVEGDAKPLTVTQLTPMCAGAAGRREAVMVEIPASARSVIESGRLAHLVTINRDDSPQVTCVWVGLDGNDIVVGKLAADQKVRNIRRDPRVSLSIEAEGDQYGMQHYLVVEGVARIEQGGAPALLHALAQRYIGPGTQFPPMPDPPEGFVIRISPTRVRGMGPWGITLP